MRHPVWRGWQPVAGLWLAADLLPAQRRLERIVRAWAPGCRAWRFDEGDVLCFEAPRPMHCEHAGGAPLCRIGAHGLYGGPLTAPELSALEPADVQLVVGAALRPLNFSRAAPLDPSFALDIGDYALHDTYDCRGALRAPRQERLARKAVRDVLGGRIPPPSEERESFLRSASARGARGDADNGSLRERVGGARDGIAHWLLSRFPSLAGGRAAQGHGSGTGAGQAAVASRATGARPQRWREWLVKAALASRAAKLMGMQHGRYLRQLMQRFDDGDLIEALRHALPIDGDGRDCLGQAFSLPGRRDHLGLSGARGAHASFDFGDYTRELLRKRYRAAFELLDRQDKVDEAVFVLAELLSARQEALDYLVRHERFGQAAELALGWDMPADTIIRLLMLAGDSERAILVARRDNAFGPAVAMLETEHRQHALRLRREWGLALVEQGQWLAAVDAVWPDSESREQAARWLLAAESAGAELSARALVQRACLLPDTLQHYAERIGEWSDPLAPAAPRVALGVALAECKHSNAALSLLSTRMLPALAADRAVGANDLDRGQLARILALSADPWLRADLPPWSLPAAVQGRRLWDAPQALDLRMPDGIGLHSPCDVAALGEGRYLVALGEAGAAVFDSGGRCLRRYAVPAFKLVIADSGQVALALAKRDSVWRIARLDLVGHQILDLGAMPLQFFADRFDGIAWSVVSGERISVIDAARPSLDTLWSVGDLGGPVAQARFLQNDELFLVPGRSEMVVWHYRTAPRRVLVSRDPIRIDGGESVLLDPHMIVAKLSMATNEDGNVRFSCTSGAYDGHIDLASPEPVDGDHDAGLIPLASGFLAIVHGADRMRLYLVRRGRGTGIGARSMAQIDWPRAQLQVREQPGRLVLFDQEGRVMEIETETSRARSMVLL
ncbi:bpX6 domain-containing protein [Lysobacter sp. CA199]|uniref:bpX6 domain-containing protein n=1 Tax=Lysobacter sp. CA199 TaxID=3455608 RepID=UPI003F8D0602